MQINVHFLRELDLKPSNNNMLTSYNSIGILPRARHDYSSRSIMVITTSKAYHIHIQLGLLIICTYDDWNARFCNNNEEYGTVDHKEPISHSYHSTTLTSYDSTSVS